MYLTGLPAVISRILSKWFWFCGPGSIIANSSLPMIKVFVPLKVIGLGFGAKIQIIFSAGCVIVLLLTGSDDNTFPFLQSYV